MSIGQRAVWSGEAPTGGLSSAPPAAPGYHRFSTRGLSSIERIELWEHHNAQALLSLDCRSIDGSPLDAVEVNLLMPQLTFAKVGANAHVVERNHHHIATTGVEGVALYFSLAGDTFFYHQDGVHLQRPGTLLVCDINQPFMRGFAHGLQEYVITVPRSVFEDAAEQPLPKTPLMFQFSDVPGGNASTAALARLVQRALAHPDPDTLLATEQSAIDLLRSIFTTDGEGSARSRRHAAISWIRSNLRDPSLSVSMVAQAIGVSERHLTRAFSGTGRGVARTILELRLEMAHRILSQSDAPKVNDVAAYCGFVSAAHFSRVFREYYGCSPSDVRA